MTYICFYLSYERMLTEYTDAQCGRLLRAMLAYAARGEEPTLKKYERYIWHTLKDQLDRDRTAYDTKCQRLRENGLKGAQARKRKQADPEETTCDPLEAIACKEREKEKKNEKENEKEREREKDTVPQRDGGAGAGGEEPLSDKKTSKSPDPTDRDEDFEHFWRIYPNRIKKQEAREAFKAVDVPVETLTLAALRQRDSALWQREGGRFIPSPAAWLRQKRRGL